LFIHAATVCRFIRGGGQLAGERLFLLIAAGSSPVKSEKELDQMYITVLPYSLRGEFDLDENMRMRDLFCRIIGSVVVLFDEMSPAGLAMILEEPKEKMISMLNCLHSVLDVPEPFHSLPM
jgi:hypothetical protein